jgi:hypothetical protein
MRKRVALRSFGFLLPLALLIGPSCSLVYDLSPDQCGSNDDCNKFGLGLSCQDGLCICASSECQGAVASGGSTNGGSANGGKGGTGGSTGGVSVGGDAGDMGTGGTSAVGGSGGSGGSGGTSKGGKGGKGGSGNTTGGTTTDAGMGGMPPEPECDQASDCYDKDPNDFNINPKACINQQCVPLKSDECQVVLPLSDADNSWSMLRSKDPIILGGFAYYQPSSIISTNIRNYDLALQELETKTGGVYAGTSSRHKLMMVVCDFNRKAQEDVLIPAKHLIEDLQVKGMDAQLLMEDQEYIFDALGTKDKNNVFFMMTRYPDQQLVSLDDSGLVWSMLSGANALSVSIQPLLDNIQTHLRNLGTVGASEDLRVTLIKASDERMLNDLGNFVSENIVFNGDTAVNQVPDAYQSLATTFYLTNPNASQTMLVQNIETFKPHVIIGATANEMPRNIMPLLESTWDAATSGQDRPFYLLSPLNYNEAQMPTLIGNDKTDPNGSTAKGKVPLHQRILGFSWPAAADQTLYNAYQLRFQEAYPGFTSPGYENYYDAAYYLLYAVAAASQPLTGTRIAAGMQRVLDGSTQVPVGPSDAMSAAITGFRDINYKIELIGAMGPPTWDQFGARNDPASIYCVDDSGVYHPDVQRFNTGTKLLDGTVPTACIDEFPYTP